MYHHFYCTTKTILLLYITLISTLWLFVVVVRVEYKCGGCHFVDRLIKKQSKMYYIKTQIKQDLLISHANLLGKLFT